MLPCLVPVLFAFYLQGVLKFKCKIPAPKGYWSSHLSLGLPTGLDEHGSHSVNFLTVLVVSILITCAALKDLIILIFQPP